jgi:hypothetical protein
MSGPFVINVADAPATRFAGSGTYVAFEDPNDRFLDFGINIHMLDPGEPNAMYHAEDNQEDFLVLAGECRAIVNGEERTLHQWDLLTGRANPKRRSCPGHRADHAASPSSRSYARIHLRMALSETRPQCASEPREAIARNAAIWVCTWKLRLGRGDSNPKPPDHPK